MSFYVVLPSNVSKSISNYTTYLSQRLDLSSEWVVALTEISYTKSWYNIQNDSEIRLLFSDAMTESETHPMLRAGFYETPQAICDGINEEIKKFNFADPPQITYNKFNNKIYIKGGKVGDETFFLAFNEEIEEMLGFYNYKREKYNPLDEDHYNLEIRFNELEMFKKGYHEARFPVEISGGYHSLYVYSDIVYPTRVGNSFTSILRQVEVPHKAEFGEQCVIKYNNPQYHSLISDEIDKISIKIMDDSGELVPFKFGRCVITLHFKKL